MMSVTAGPVIIAHRGASAVTPENTRASIARAIEMGAKVIEFDVRETSDGNLVLFHDDTLDRLAGREGKIESLTLEEVKTLDVGRWFGREEAFIGERVALFSEAVEQCLEAGVTPLIERKTGTPEAYAAVLESLEATDRVIVQAFDWVFLQGIKGQLPTLEIGALGSKTIDPERLNRLRELKPTWVGWKFSDLTVEDLARLKESDFRVALWTVNDPAEAARWLKAGVDGIITDYPDKMLKLE